MELAQISWSGAGLCSACFHRRDRQIDVRVDLCYCFPNIARSSVRISTQVQCAGRPGRSSRWNALKFYQLVEILISNLSTEGIVEISFESSSGMSATRTFLLSCSPRVMGVVDVEPGDCGCRSRRRSLPRRMSMMMKPPESQIQRAEFPQTAPIDEG